MDTTMVPQPHPLACRYDAVHEGILAILHRNRRPGENDFETAERMIVNEALGLFGGYQRSAAQYVGVKKVMFNYKCKNLGIRPRDRA